METLRQALREAEQTQVYRYEVVHDIIQKLTNNRLQVQALSEEKTPVSLLDYKVQKANVAQYGQLTREVR
ncbi:hypothetical protein [Parageobacillus galactosidasius]|uniref:hypothetical protein n=1 Tax=Parageobacillus galactosidasius TaxID=883812 RepID=UPI001FEBE395|nr:hypothetical protein [Parageobacillus galactosidasius]